MANPCNLHALTVEELLSASRNRLSIPLAHRRRKEALVSFINAHADATLRAVLEEAVAAKGTPPRRRTRTEQQAERRVARRISEDEQPDPEKFLELPQENEVKACYRAFYEATSKSATLSFVCAVCAQEVMCGEEAMSTVPISEVPNPQRLFPTNPHPAHDLYEGMLLEPEGVSGDAPGLEVCICATCIRSLHKASESQLPPRLSLANGLWVGRIPPELASLTIPERLLISDLYPRVYVFKLYPKNGFSGDESLLQSAMRGTVSTYELDVDGLTDMIQGNLMPRRPSILASLLSVTIVGAGKLPKAWLRTTFRVRRHEVARALLWLKENNPKYYGNIILSEEILQELPEDDIPPEILGIVRQCEDTGVVDQESSGYVPEDEAAEGQAQTQQMGGNSADVPNTAEGPEVIPLSIAGAIDTDLTKMSANEMMLWGLSNLWKEGKEGGYVVRHGRNPVNDFPPAEGRSAEDEDTTEITSNFFERAFPGLYPYGTGGLEARRRVPVELREHVQWSLQYHDRRFRKHETFAFVTFGILQRRQALTSARIQMRRQNFDRDAAILSSITLEQIDKARREESAHQPISDPAVQLLRTHVHATASRVQGSDQARYQLRSQIWSTVLKYGGPVLWITWNPSDVHDPIAQVFAGTEIDLDHFMSTTGPSSEERARTIAADPFAASKFFHFMVRTMFETLLQIRTTSHTVKSGMGVLGQVAAYVGSVESQGRGTLHLHTLIWLCNAPSPAQLHTLLEDEEFRGRMAAFIQTNIRSYLPGLETAESVKAIPKERDIAFNRPPDPDAMDYDEQLQRFELQLARAEQVHTCKPRRCLIYKHGQLTCKRRAPFPCSDEDVVLPNGEWKSKRLYGYVNSWMPAILINGRCNNDIKFLTSGADTRNITFYVACYSAKKQGKSHNLSAILANGFAYHESHPKPEYVNSLRDQQCLLLFRMANTINREQELAGVMVVSYLMGWGDVYRSHTYSPIFWTGFSAALLRAFPMLSVIQTDSDDERESAPRESDEDSVDAAPEGEDNEDEETNVTLDLSVSGTLIVKSQVTDYCYRGEELSRYSVLQFFTETYEDNASAKDLADRADEEADDARRGPGRPRNPRSHYLPGHPKHRRKVRINRTAGHRNLPNIIGRWFPRNDDDGVANLYCASMLVLLKPWRNLRTDLKLPSQTWREAFDAFTAAAGDDVRYVLEGIQYYHDCKIAADRDMNEPLDPERPGQRNGHGDYLDDDENGFADGAVQGTDLFSEEGLQVLRASQVSWRESMNALLAVEAAKLAGIFADEATRWPVSGVSEVGNATGDDLRNLEQWRAQMKEKVTHMNGPGDLQGASLPNDPGPSVDRQETSELHTSSAPQVSRLLGPEDALPAVDIDELREDQFRAFDIMAWHFEETRAGRQPPPLRMILYGEGGTGKSRVIQTITEVFTAAKCDYLLVKAAYTGIAASLIDGKTTHSLCHIPLTSTGTISDEARAKLQAYWYNRKYLVIDEFSMIAKSFFAKILRSIAAGLGGGNEGLTGLNIILCGDLHQFPPVAVAPAEALYKPTNLEQDSADRMLGRKFYEEFTTVVILKEQMRVSDPIWRDFLTHLRHGNVEQPHIEMLRGLVLGANDEDPPNFDEDPWIDAALVTPRHAVRQAWNAAAVRRWCAKTGNQLFIVPAEDRIKGRPLTLREKYALADRSRTERQRRRKDLADEVEIAIGMKVMVTSNIETDLDVANGARGEVIDIVLDPDEPPIQQEPIVKLQRPPAYILVKLQRTRAPQLQGLEDRIIPVEPMSVSMQIQISQDNSNKPVRRTVKRRQYPITAAYAFTDYRSQGQTIPTVVVDMHTPPGGRLTLFNLYVALSRSSGRQTIRLLRGFDEGLLKQRHDEDLSNEDDRLEVLNSVTKEWWLRMGRQRRLSESMT